jgi:hypothetical protein
MLYYILRMTFDDFSLHFRTARPLIILRAKNAPLMLSFFYKVFIGSKVTTISNSELKQKLASYLEDLEYNERDEELTDAIEFDDCEARAGQYIEKWSNAGFLRKYPNDAGADLHELTADTRKVINWIEDLQRREHVGTNSRFKDIFFKLKNMIEKTTQDVRLRIEDLENKKAEIENEINLLRLGKEPSLFDDIEIKEQFYDLNKMARELLGDFAEVEQNFEVIRKEIQRKYGDRDSVKGALLVYALDGLDEIENKPQGKSFKAFWEFLMDEKKQQEFTDLTDKLYQLLNERQIDYNNDKFLRYLKRFLHASGRKVIDSNKKLSEKISRVLSEKNRLERRRAIELIGEIRQMAYSLIDEGIKDDSFLTLEDEPHIDLFDRWELWEESENNLETQFPDGLGGLISDDVDLRSLFDQFNFDKKILLHRIDLMLNDVSRETKTQVTLKEIVDRFGIDNGLSEVVGYFSIAAESPHHLIIEEVNEPISLGDRKINVPMILYTKPKN